MRLGGPAEQVEVIEAELALPDGGGGGGQGGQLAGAAQLDGGGGGSAGRVAGQAGCGAARAVAGPHAAPGPLVEELGGDDAEAGSFVLQGDDGVVELVVVEQGGVERGEGLDRVVESVEARRHGASIHEHLFDSKHLFVDGVGLLGWWTERFTGRNSMEPRGSKRRRRNWILRGPDGSSAGSS